MDIVGEMIINSVFCYGGRTKGACKLSPVVQSIIRLTKSLVLDLLSLPECTHLCLLIFLVKKYKAIFALQKFLTTFWQNGSVFAFNKFEFLTTHSLTTSLFLNSHPRQTPRSDKRWLVVLGLTDL